MVRERLRGMQERTWWHHAVASGPELILALLALWLMPYLFTVSLPYTHPHPLDIIPFPTMTLITVAGVVGAVAWLYGWVQEKRRGLTRAAVWDQFGSAQQALAYGAGTLMVAFAPGTQPTTVAFTAATALVWASRYLATRALLRRSVDAEPLVQRADEALEHAKHMNRVNHRGEGEGDA